MQLSPRYGSDPVIVMDGDPSGVAAVAIAQRRRLAETLATFTAEQWAQPSRCDGWTSRDVIVHLAGTNPFWALAIQAGVRGEPTRYLATFDPVTTPPQMVAATPVSDAEAIERFCATSDALCDLWASLDDDGWRALAEAPPGHVSVSALTHHALWDSWVHERDVLLPLSITPVISDDEVTACLRYAIALGPALALNRGSARRGTLSIETTNPAVSASVVIAERVEVRNHVDHADLALTGDAVELLEAFSVRRAFPATVPVEQRWMLDGLVAQFDQG